MFFDWSSTLSLMVYPHQLLINIMRESDRKKERESERVTERVTKRGRER